MPDSNFSYRPAEIPSALPAPFAKIRGFGIFNACAKAFVALLYLCGGAGRPAAAENRPYLASTKQNEYYGDSISLLTLLLLSGNWWAPDAALPTTLAPVRNRSGKVKPGTWH